MKTIVIGALGLLLAGCSASAAAPREIQVGVDACEYCHMAVDDPDRAAEWVEPDGRVQIFDEPGCMVAWLGDHPGVQGTAFVADALGDGWIPAEEATFVRGATRTGMGFDVLAYRDGGAAAAIAQERGGTVLSWSELQREGVGDAHPH